MSEEYAPTGPVGALRRHARARRTLWEIYIADHERGLFEETPQWHVASEAARDAYRAVPLWLDWAAWLIERWLLFRLDFRRRMGSAA